MAEAVVGAVELIGPEKRGLLRHHMRAHAARSY